MSGVKHRTCFYDDSTGVVRWQDWALVKTAVGDCCEPNPVLNRRHMPDTDFANFDPTDMISRVDAIERVDLKRQYTFLGDACGGVHLPKSGP